MAKKSSALSRRNQPHRVKQNDTMLTEKMIKKLKELKHKKIDLSDEDAQELTNWEESVIGKFYRPIKKQSTVRIDVKE